MITAEAVEQVIFQAIESLNAERSPSERIEPTATTPLFGADAVLDSLSLVSVIVDVETALNEEHGLAVSLTDDRAMSRKESPYASVATLRDYVLECARAL